MNLFLKLYIYLSSNFSLTLGYLNELEQPCPQKIIGTPFLSKVNQQGQKQMKLAWFFQHFIAKFIKS